MVGTWRLVAAGGWRRLAAVDGSWRLAVGGPLGRSLAKKKSHPLRTALPQPSALGPVLSSSKAHQDHHIILIALETVHRLHVHGLQPRHAEVGAQRLLQLLDLRATRHRPTEGTESAPNDPCLGTALGTAPGATLGVRFCGRSVVNDTTHLLNKLSSAPPPPQTHTPSLQPKYHSHASPTPPVPSPRPAFTEVVEQRERGSISPNSTQNGSAVVRALADPLDIVHSPAKNRDGLLLCCAVRPTVQH